MAPKATALPLDDSPRTHPTSGWGTVLLPLAGARRLRGGSLGGLLARGGRAGRLRLGRRRGALLGSLVRTDGAPSLLASRNRDRVLLGIASGHCVLLLFGFNKLRSSQAFFGIYRIPRPCPSTTRRLGLISCQLLIGWPSFFSSLARFIGSISAAAASAMVVPLP